MLSPFFNIPKYTDMRAIFTTGGVSRFSTCFRKKNGKLVNVSFEPPVLNGVVGRATFSTSDTELIELIKKSQYFGTAIFLVKEFDTTPTPVEAPKAKNYRDLCTDQENIIEEPNVVDIPTAQNWCQSTHGEVFSARKADTIQAEAAKKFNTVFPNWK